jgi:hypothetical protein
VQQGVVCKNGTTCPGGPPDTRNLLDFNDITVDSRGRIVAAYADGCITDNCVNLPDHSTSKEGNDGSATLTLIRQRGGMRLFAAFDTNGPPPPPPVNVTKTSFGNYLTWTTPDDGGSPLTVYRIYRGISGQGETLIAEVKPSVLSYKDAMKRRDSRYYYRVTAVNAYGESPRNLKFFPNTKGE